MQDILDLTVDEDPTYFFFHSLFILLLFPKDLHYIYHTLNLVIHWEFVFLQNTFGNDTSYILQIILFYIENN